MDIDIARTISRVLASEQRAREAEERARKAEERAKRAEGEAYQAQCEVEVPQIQLGEAQQLASQAIGLCADIDRTGNHIREEGVYPNGQPARTSIPKEIHNLMVEILRIDQDSDEEAEDTDAP